MEKTFEDQFSELLVDMVRGVYQSVEDDAEELYIIAFCKNRTVYSGAYFYKIHNTICSEKDFDVLDVFIKDMLAIDRLCQENHQETPAQIRMIYSIPTGQLQTDIRYTIEQVNKIDNELALEIMWRNEVRQQMGLEPELPSWLFGK